ncbi:hypothetical protein [Lentzea aerocolonigenes]|uniref:hypothetical protein n=1 Tax=Lentzea aerocolonigenes TaxID=68170 RepID=UPI000A6FB651|nr:hypothetical protein [Lentzea aerocolonigenes]MCP2249079.1 hypothetical protein [Lentzea aerocolonigenes]
MTASRYPQGDWSRLRPDTAAATEDLLVQLRSGTSSQDLLDTYLYAKRLLAESMQAYVRLGLPERCEEFHELRAQLGTEMERRYGGTVPAAYLAVPYGSRVHEELFSLLLQRKGQNVEAALLRVVTADSVHTERRLRELRELGMDIVSLESNDIDYYVLGSLDLTYELIPAIIRNTAKRKKYVAMSKKDLIAIVGDDD